MVRKVPVIIFALICSNINAADIPMTQQEKNEPQKQRAQSAINITKQLGENGSRQRSWVASSVFSDSSTQQIMLENLGNGSYPHSINSKITNLYIDIKNAGNSSVSFDVPRSVKKIEFNGENLGNASICFYMAHTPADMKENIINKQNASISTFHPMRKYTAQIIGFSALTIGATIGWLILKKE